MVQPEAYIPERASQFTGRLCCTCELVPQEAPNKKCTHPPCPMCAYAVLPDKPPLDVGPAPAGWRCLTCTAVRPIFDLVRGDINCCDEPKLGSLLDAYGRDYFDASPPGIFGRDLKIEWQRNTIQKWLWIFPETWREHQTWRWIWTDAAIEIGRDGEATESLGIGG